MEPINIPRIQLVEFTIPMEPYSQQHGLKWNKYSRKPYNDPKKTLYLDTIIGESKHLAPKEPYSGPLGMELRFFLKREKGEQLEGLAWQEAPDCDNLAKSFCDGLAKAKFVKNDCMIAHWELWKFWAEADLFPRVSVTFYQYKP